MHIDNTKYFATIRKISDLNTIVFTHHYTTSDDKLEGEITEVGAKMLEKLIDAVEFKKMIKDLLIEIEKKETNLNIAGGKGYGVGKAYPNKTVGVLKMLGNENAEEQEEYVLKPVEISKAFKRRK